MRGARLTVPLVSALKEPHLERVGFSYARICRCEDLGRVRANSVNDEPCAAQHPFSDAVTVLALINLASALVSARARYSFSIIQTWKALQRSDIRASFLFSVIIWGSEKFDQIATSEHVN